MAKKYNVSLRAANNWLNNKERDGFVRRNSKKRPIQGVFTNKAKELVKILKSSNKDLMKLDVDLTKKVSQTHIKDN